MSRNKALKKLSEPWNLHQTPPPPLRLPGASPSLSAVDPSTTAAAARAQLTRLSATFDSYLKQRTSAVTPRDLLHFLRSRLGHNPALGYLDYHLSATPRRSTRSATTTTRSSTCSDPSPPPTASIPSDLSSTRSVDPDDSDTLYSFNIMRRLIDGKPDVALYNIAIQVTFNTLISGYCRSNKFDQALQVFGEMKEKGCLPNVTGLVEGGKIMEVADLMIEFLRKGVLPKEFDSFVLVEILCIEGKAKRALELMDKLWDKGYKPSSIVCRTLVEGLRGVGLIENSVGLVRRMLEDGIIPDIVTFSCVLRDMCGAGSAREANELRLLACKNGLVPDSMVCRILVLGCVEEGRKKEGEVLVNEMLDRGFLPDIASYNMLMDRLAKSKASYNDSKHALS
ncbi:pentatricopeptide repeat-containing protein [Striga asiatica]|uniref:Pentatricopeptide repeat-containing protein n=1 Tax=Striga asiatica TaxID=4170 RepID=A0A5A7QE89_STRAF|nr:pentatricopeptide repeat-containing protein [Striga asiatica]